MTSAIDPPIAQSPSRPTASTSTRTGQFTRVGGVLGIGFVVLIITALIARGDVPTWGDSADTVREYWETDGGRYLTSQYLASIGSVVFFAGFLVALSAIFDTGGALHRSLSRFVVVAGGLHIVLVLAADAAWATLGSTADRLDDESLVVLNSLDRGAYQAAGFTLGLFVLSTSVAVLATRTFSPWIGYVGLVAAAGLLVSPLSIHAEEPEAALESIGFISAVLTLLVVVVMAIQMIRGHSKAPESPPTDS